MEFTQETVTRICNEHGHCYLDTYVAKAFNQASGRPQEEVLYVLRQQEKSCLAEERGKGKFARARERACMLLAAGWETGLERNIPFHTALIATHEHATAYGILARRGQ